MSEFFFDEAEFTRPKKQTRKRVVSRRTGCDGCRLALVYHEAASSTLVVTSIVFIGVDDGVLNRSVVLERLPRLHGVERLPQPANPGTNVLLGKRCIAK